ncbi:hypothetical protein EDD16DRAFT_1684441 [Pisolithus croceorrhizus]|nr:hypothetical protein EDD16DRAFT_1684441 [Pisolithus croceorrhizus]
MRSFSLSFVAHSGGEVIVSILITRVLQASKVGFMAGDGAPTYGFFEATDIAGLAAGNPGLYRLINRLAGRAIQFFLSF